MELTPNEMRNHEFSTSMRGFDRAEVRAFIEGAATALEEAKAQILKLKEEKNSLESKYEQLKNLEDTIKSAVLEAQKSANQIVANAKKEAELLVEEAKLERGKSIEENYKKVSELESRIREMEHTKETFYSKLRSEIEAHLKLVDSICPPDKDSFKSEEVSPDENDQDNPELEMKDEDIDSVVDQLGEEPPSDEPVSEIQEQEKQAQDESESKEEVRDGQPQPNDY